jgi:hypothetical protein
MDELVSEVAAASREQSQGIDQVNVAVSQMDKVTQSNAANAEETASASEELSAQAHELEAAVGNLMQLVEGSTSSGISRPVVSRTPLTKAKLTAPSADPKRVHVAMVPPKRTGNNGGGDNGKEAAGQLPKEKTPLLATARAKSRSNEEVIPMDKDFRDF